MGNSNCLQARGENSENYMWENSANWDLKTVLPEEQYTISPAELLVVKNSWTQITAEKSIRSFAYTLFEKLFVLFPDKSKLLFLAETGAFISTQQWKEHALFAQHIREIVGSMHTIIQLLDRDDKLREYLENLEEFHRSLRGMNKYYMEVFVRVIDESMAHNFKELYDGDTRLAFRKVLTMVYFKLTWRLLL